MNKLVRLAAILPLMNFGAYSREGHPSLEANPEVADRLNEV